MNYPYIFTVCFLLSFSSLASDSTEVTKVVQRAKSRFVQFFYKDKIFAPQVALAESQDKIYFEKVLNIFSNKAEFNDVTDVINWIESSFQEMSENSSLTGRAWKDVSTSQKQKYLDHLKLSLEIKPKYNSAHMSVHQIAIIKDGLERVQQEINAEKIMKLRSRINGQIFHEYWRQNSDYRTRWLPAQIVLEDTQKVEDQETLKQYFNENKVPENIQQYFKLKDKVVFQDIQNTPFQYLAINHQRSNIDASHLAIQLMDQLWENESFLTTVKIKKWLVSAVQSIHQANLKRDISQSSKDYAFNLHWKNLPYTNKSHNLAHLEIAFRSRFKADPSSISFEKYNRIMDAFNHLKKIHHLTYECESYFTNL